MVHVIISQNTPAYFTAKYNYLYRFKWPIMFVFVSECLFVSKIYPCAFKYALKKLC